MRSITVYLKKGYAAVTALSVLGLLLVYLLVSKGIVSREAFSNGQKAVSLPVLMYHSVCINKNANSEYVLTPQSFEEDMEYLYQNGYTAVSGEQVTAFLRGEAFLPEKPILITFDDGFYNNLSVCLPILQKYDFRAILHFVGEYTRESTKTGDVNPAYSYLTWQQLNTLIESKQVEIGSHTWNMHALKERFGCTRLKNESEEEYTQKLSEDIKTLNRLLFFYCGKTPQAFAYPYGAVTESSKQLLFDLGFDLLFTCEEKTNTVIFGQGEKILLGRFNRYSSMTTKKFMEKYGI